MIADTAPRPFGRGPWSRWRVADAGPGHLTRQNALPPDPRHRYCGNLHKPDLVGCGKRVVSRSGQMEGFFALELGEGPVHRVRRRGPKTLAASTGCFAQWKITKAGRSACLDGPGRLWGRCDREQYAMPLIEADPDKRRYLQPPMPKPILARKLGAVGKLLAGMYCPLCRKTGACASIATHDAFLVTFGQAYGIPMWWAIPRSSRPRTRPGLAALQKMRQPCLVRTREDPARLSVESFCPVEPAISRALIEGGRRRMGPFEVVIGGELVFPDAMGRGWPLYEGNRIFGHESIPKRHLTQSARAPVAAAPRPELGQTKDCSTQMTLFAPQP